MDFGKVRLCMRERERERETDRRHDRERECGRRGTHVLLYIFPYLHGA